MFHTACKCYRVYYGGQIKCDAAYAGSTKTVQQTQLKAEFWHKLH